MTFLWPNLLWLSPLLLLSLLLVWRAGDRRRSRNAGRLADERLFRQIVRSPAPRRQWWLRALQLLALAALLVAAARPQARPPLPVNKAAVVIALDASRSMLADDVDPNRLEVARELARDFVNSTPASAMVGVASFSDSAFVLVPPTSARTEVLDALDRVEPASNTSLAAAIIAGVRMLPGREDAQPPEQLTGATANGQDDPQPQPASDVELPPGRILVLSDGVTNVSATPGLPARLAVELALAFAEAQEVAVYTIPIGREGGAVSNIDGRDYFVPFDGDTLASMSERTGGLLVDADEPDELRQVFAELGRMIRWEATELEVSALLSALAALLLVTAGALGLTTSRRLP